MPLRQGHPDMRGMDLPGDEAKRKQQAEIKALPEYRAYISAHGHFGPEHDDRAWLAPVLAEARGQGYCGNGSTRDKRIEAARKLLAALPRVWSCEARAACPLGIAEFADLRPHYRYTVRTDAVMHDNILAASADEAAREFSAGEFPGRKLESVDDLFAHINRIGDGAWCWIEGHDAPDGERQDSRW